MKGHVPKVEKEEERQWILNVLDGHKEDYSYLVNRYKNIIEGYVGKRPTTSEFAG
ncbi:hypothetical protein [Paenibacillus sp. FSL R5-0470]|uniref:hypothetical protein n=1 Tax=Paenibacillus sp. FSL R5-0470 TaxID=2921641 RepID=UPI0030D96826